MLKNHCCQCCLLSFCHCKVNTMHRIVGGCSFALWDWHKCHRKNFVPPQTFGGSRQFLSISTGNCICMPKIVSCERELRVLPNDVFTCECPTDMSFPTSIGAGHRVPDCNEALVQVIVSRTAMRRMRMNLGMDN